MLYMSVIYIKKEKKNIYIYIANAYIYSHAQSLELYTDRKVIMRLF